MKEREISKSKQELQALCDAVREFVRKGEYKKCERKIFHAMKMYTHAPEPHNLIGIVLEKEGDHHLAMKHFRAAWALNPTYMPAQQNLDSFGTFFAKGKGAFDESDCLHEDNGENIIEYDAGSAVH